MGDSVNSNIADNIEDTSEKIWRTTRNKHTFLGVYIEFIGRKKFELTTPHHVNKILKDFGEAIKRNVVNPATSQLFTIANEAKILMMKRRSFTTQYPPRFYV